MRNHPLLAALAGVDPVNELSVRDRLAQCRLVQAPKPAGIRKGNQPSNGVFRLDAMRPEFLAREVDLVIPHDAAAAGVHLNRRKKNMVLQGPEGFEPIQERCDVLDLGRPAGELNRQPQIRKRMDIFDLVEHLARLL